MDRMSSTMPPESDIGVHIEMPSPTDDEIATLAYRLWMDRGCPIGSPAQDWFQAETELKSHQRAFIAAA
jgi:hypothetical protein